MPPGVGLAKDLVRQAQEDRTVEVQAERTVSRLLGGSCRVPLAAWCVSTPGSGLKLVARVAARALAGWQGNAVLI